MPPRGRTTVADKVKEDVCAAGSCQWCGCIFRVPSDMLHHRCAAMQKAIDAATAVNPAAQVVPVPGGLLRPQMCPHCGRAI